MERSSGQSRIFGLDFMRASAIMLVLFGHCAWIFPCGNTAFSALMALAGFLGVEIFFVLSGFLIGRIVYRQFTEDSFTPQTVFRFLRRRLFRTFPNYFLLLIVNILIAFWIGYPIGPLWRYFIFLQNFASPMLSFFTESWSLSVEEFAYLLLPFALLAAAVLFSRRGKPMHYLWTVLLLIGIFIAAKIIHNPGSALTLEQWNLGVKSVVIFRLDSIFIGVLAGWLYDNYHAYWKRAQIYCAFSGMLLIGFFTFGVGRFQLTIDRFPFFWNVVYLPLASVAVACFLPLLSEWKSEKSAIARAVTFISLISYSIYLVHYGVVLQLLKHFVNTDVLSPPEILVFTAFYFTLTFALSYLLYRFYEKPMTDKRDAVRKR